MQPSQRRSRMKTIREVLVMATVLFIYSGCPLPDWI
jgi:hypothetical protein